MKKLLAALMVVFLAGFCAALTVSTDKNSVEKGQIVLFSGFCEKEMPVFVKATSHKFMVFEASFQCPQAGEWSIPQEIGFITPTGTLQVAFTQGSTVKKVFLEILPSRQSSLFLVDFFNKPPSGANRLDLVVLDLKLLENNQPVKDANVFFWDFNGTKQQMNEAGQGIYRGVLKIPTSALLEKFDLFIEAEKTVENEKRGTEFSTQIEISQAPILLTIEKPSRFSFEIGKIIEWNVKASYLDGSSLEGPEVFLLIDGVKNSLNPTGGNFFAGSIIPIEGNTQTKQVTLVAKDAFGNTTEVEKTIVFSTGVYSGIYQFFIWAIVLLVIGLGVWKIVLPKMKNVSTQVKRPSLEKGIREKIKKVQTQYYSDQSINRKEYQEKMNEFQKQLDEMKKL